MKTSDQLERGRIYTRDDLREMFDITDATLNTGVFQPPGTDSVWLFVTEEKSSQMTPYTDSLRGDRLTWEGQKSGRSNKLILEHEERGLEILVFYRKRRKQYPKSGFRYEGPFRYVSHRGDKPAEFVLERVTGK